MKPSARRLVRAFGFFFALVLVAPVAPVVAAKEVSAISDAFFPIMPYNNAPTNAALLRRMRECGFNLAGFVTPAALDACHAAGLRAIVADPRVTEYDWTNVDSTRARSNITSLVRQVGRHPAVFGYKLRDEPNLAMLPGLGEVAGLVREIAPGKFPYINLFPNYAGARWIGTTNYTEYLETFAATCRPPIISYDNYSLLDNGSVDGAYWTNLELIRALARKHGAEFWNTILAAAHFDYREPTAADFRLLAYTTLAYGGRGLCWFTYFATGPDSHLAPVDQFGHESPTWYLLQNINLQVQHLAPTILQLTNTAVYHLGEIPEGCSGPAATNLVTAMTAGNFVIGEFTHRDGTAYVLIVNKDLARARRCQPQFRTAPRQLQIISPFTGRAEKYDREFSWLAPGAGALLKFEP